jgi:molybdopterin-guanine dinucleotide biosynthesis protein A
MGTDKALLPYRGGTLLSHLIRTYTGAFDAVAVSADRKAGSTAKALSAWLTFIPARGLWPACTPHSPGRRQKPCF